jgi:hypothetical protein
MKRMILAYPKRCPGMIIVAAAIFLSAGGCSSQRHAVIASTGTNIGLEIAQNPANQLPQGKLGYNRAELAIVPTNRSSDNAPTGQGNGAADVADVIMEIKFSRIFSQDSGIYQRLAVGKTAVSQAGAAFMFARDTKGELDPTAAKQLSALYSVSATDTSIRAEKAKLSQFHGKAEKAKKDIIEAEVKKIGYGSWDNFSDGCPNEPTFENMTKLKEALKSQGIDID